MEGAADDRDSPWKEALDRYLEQALRLLFPEIHAQIDWTRRWQSLDGELQAVVRDAESGRRFADKVFRVYLRTGDEVWVVLHVEVQGEVDHRLPVRVRVYRQRLGDRYGVPVASLVVLADDDPRWRPTAFEEVVLDCRERLEFPTVKLLDFEARSSELMADPNPFALVVLAHLGSMRTRKRPHDRLDWRLTLLRALYDRGYEREDVLEVLRFLDWLLALPPPLEAIFVERHALLEKERNMPYKMNFEVEAEARGEVKGRRESIFALLDARFGPLSPEVVSRVGAITGSEELAALLRKAATAPTLDDVLRELDAR